MHVRGIPPLPEPSIYKQKLRNFAYAYVISTTTNFKNMG